MTIVVSIGSAVVLGMASFLLILTIVGFIFGIESGLIAGLVVGGMVGTLSFFAGSVSVMLAVPAVMMENLGVFAGIKRSFELVRRSVFTSINVFLIMFLIPMVLASLTTLFINLLSREVERNVNIVRLLSQPSRLPPKMEMVNRLKNAVCR